uniref:Uncharacterized protein n=1 Tax=Ditylenchus dipsaci TaxID=166011 RepID=A0A915EB11_9BILA
MLKEVPIRLFRESTSAMLQLNLSHNEIEDVQPFLLQNFSSLKELDVSNNKLKSLSYGIFNGLEELTIYT